MDVLTTFSKLFECWKMYAHIKHFSFAKYNQVMCLLFVINFVTLSNSTLYRTNLETHNRHMQMITKTKYRK